MIPPILHPMTWWRGPGASSLAYPSMPSAQVPRAAGKEVAFEPMSRFIAKLINLRGALRCGHTMKPGRRDNSLHDD